MKAVELAPLLKRLLKIVIEIQIASPRSALQKELQVGNTKPVAGVFFFSAINRDVRRCPGVRDKGAVEAAVFRPQIGYYKSIEEEAAALMGSPGNNPASSTAISASLSPPPMSSCDATAFASRSKARTDTRSLAARWTRQARKLLPRGRSALGSTRLVPYTEQMRIPSVVLILVASSFVETILGSRLVVLR